MAIALAAAPARADEPWLLSAEASYAQPLTEPQRSLFSPGLSGAVTLERPLVPWFALGLQLRGGLLFDGQPPADGRRVDPGVGTLATLSGVVRVRPLADPGDPARGTGLWIEGAAGGGLTGGLGRGALEVAAGWGFAAGPTDVAPVVRYVQVVEGQDKLDPRDARLLLVGVEVTLFDERPQAADDPEGPGDRDGDGLLDPNDDCPDRPEDKDGFEDADGCPDPDNDADGIPDEDDECPLEPEDADDFADGDGCPDPDNDADGILDDEDECPDEAEVINGNADEDGCPDEGLIELVDNRIVLDARVLFDLERARIKRSAEPVLEAIVELWRQHPEWAKLRIEGHADVRGPERYNQRLSSLRARRTQQQLVELGIPERIIEAEGYGSSRPRDLRRTERAHQRNRRVEFVVVARDGAEADGNRDDKRGP